MPSKKIISHTKKHLPILLGVAAFGIVLYVLMWYSKKKRTSESSENHAPFDPLNTVNGTLLGDVSTSNIVPQTDSDQYSSVTDVVSTDLPASQTPQINPSELLPKDNNTEFARMHPVSSSNVADTIVTPGPRFYLSMTKPLRNANLQLRSDPPVPQKPVSPWNNTTITPDESRLPLEVGCKL